jgi:hypothetical protein
MAVPISLQTYPANLDTGIPIGISVDLIFDRGIDLSTGRHSVVLYGDDYDQTSGPDQAMWIDQDTGSNPYFLRSPGFKGLVELTAVVTYVDLDSGPTYTEVDPGVITSEADEAAYGVAGVGHKLTLTPRESLAPDIQYRLHVLGEANGISSRTVFDTVPDGGNASTTGLITVYGGYDGAQGTDSVVIEITDSGDIGVAKYRWYYTGLGAGSAVTGKLTARRFRRLADGLQIRFQGSGFVSGDTFVVGVEAPERMIAPFVVDFTTNDGSYTTAPASPSTPAVCSPPASVLPPAPGAITAVSPLAVVEMIPENGSYYNSLDTRTITVIFTEDVDPATITDTSVRVYRYPVSGVYNGQRDVQELEKILSVSGDTLTIDI